jgi:hypothetical protein
MQHPFSSRRLRFLAILPLTTLALCAVVAFSYRPEAFAPSPIEGRWDLTINKNGKELPSWLEVSHSGIKSLVGSFVAEGGSARPVSKIKFEQGKISFSIPPQWDEGDQEMVFEGVLEGDQMTGTIYGSDKINRPFKGVRAPALIRDREPAWGKPMELFNGKNLDGWRHDGKKQWSAEEGLLRNNDPGSNLITEKKFNDFKLHIEFRYPKGSNSGVYLRGRYEVQISDNLGDPPLRDFFGAIYGFIEPSHQMAKAPGEWQVYDITFVGRQVTVTANGRTVICNQVIPGITGGALDSREGEPGPIMLQGDHGKIDYRNIVITPAVE